MQRLCVSSTVSDITDLADERQPCSLLHCQELEHFQKGHLVIGNSSHPVLSSHSAILQSPRRVRLMASSLRVANVHVIARGDVQALCSLN